MTPTDYHMPAEWAPHYATLLSWPRNPATWPGDKLDKVEQVFAALVSALAGRERVLINAGGIEARVSALLTQAGISPDAYTLLPFVTNDCWARDHGPIGVAHRPTGEIALTDWGYNAWGGKYPPFDADDRIPAQVAGYLGLPVLTPGIILEGGSIEVDGAGTLLTTRSCLLNPNRNPHLAQAEIEGYLRQYLGAGRILWLEDGIIGDDTDGHIDDLTRLVGTERILTILEGNLQDENYAVLQENFAALQTFTTPAGKPYRIDTLPMPAALVVDGERLPASYANYYIANGAILLPVFRDPNDAAAIRLLEEAFPQHEIVPIDCRHLLWGLGGLHCVTQQIPAGPNLL
ncbi:MAG: agmatine deiminase family protein [Bacteroidetes bacterium]|nr:agmatine deiminase family protein [Bacteroidota bacterium]